jgi:hypothetical protein
MENAAGHPTQRPKPNGDYFSSGSACWADKGTGRKGIVPTALKAMVAEAGAEPGEA